MRMKEILFISTTTMTTTFSVDVRIKLMELWYELSNFFY